MLRVEIIGKLQAVFDELYSIGFPRTCAPFIAGGAIASLVLDEEPKDYDIWFPSLDAWEHAVNSLSLNHSWPTRQSKYSWTYTLPSGKIVQLVKSRTGGPRKVVGTFDFQHTMSYFDGLQLVCDEEFIKSKALTFVKGNLCHPVNTVQRLLKFSRRGYSINNQTIADIMNEVGQIYCKVRDERIADDDYDRVDDTIVFHPGYGGGGEDDSR